MTAKHFRPVERLDEGYDLATSQEARKRLNLLHPSDPLLNLAGGSWYSEAEALAVAVHLTESLFGRERTLNEVTRVETYDGFGLKGTEGY